MLPSSSSSSSSFDEKYEVLRELARGGMGIVALARQRATGAEVVIKTLQAHLDEAARQRFEREAQVLANLNHPHIVRVHDCGVLRGRPYLVMAYVNGEEWRARVEAELEAGQLPDLDASLRILTQLASALEYCHARGVAHRDLKPSNILLDADTGRALLADFGLVKTTGIDSQGLTRTGELLGTPHYMSPERFDSSASAHPAESGDIWAFGVTAWYGLTGQLPFDGDNAIELVARITAGAPSSIRAQRPDLPRWLCELCEDCLARDPEDRPSAAELSQRLRERSARPRSRRRLLAAGLFLLVALAAGAVQWLPREPAQLHLEPAPAVQREASATLRGRVANADALWLRSAAGRKPLSFDETGAFELSLPLEPGENRLSLAALGDGEPARIELTITRDVEPPRLELAPIPEQAFEDSLMLEGELSEAGCEVRVNGELAEVAERRLRARVPLALGRNALRIEVVDGVGLRAEVELAVTRGALLRVRPGESLAEVLAGLTAPTRVIVEAGRYEEPLLIKQSGVELIAEGEVVIAPPRGVALLNEAASARIEGLVLQACGGLMSHALAASRGRLTARACRLVGAPGATTVHCGDPSVIDPSDEPAVICLEDCEVLGESLIGVKVRPRGRFEMRGGRIVAQELHSLSAGANASLQLREVEVAGSVFGLAIEAPERAPTQADLERCTFTRATKNHLSARGPGARISARSCIFSESQQDLITAHEGAALELEGCELRAPSFAALWARRSQIFARRCHVIVGPVHPLAPSPAAIQVDDEGAIQVLDCDFESQRNPTFFVSQGARLILDNNRFSSGDGTIGGEGEVEWKRGAR